MATPSNLPNLDFGDLRGFGNAPTPTPAAPQVPPVGAAAAPIPPGETTLRGSIGGMAQRAWQATKGAASNIGIPGSIDQTLQEANHYLRDGAQPGPMRPPVSSLGRVSNLVGSGLRRAAAPLAVGAEALDAAKTMTDPNADPIDREAAPARAISNATGGLTGAYAGGMAGAALGATMGPLAPITVPVGAAVGGLAGGVAGREGVNKAFDWATGRMKDSRDTAAYGKDIQAQLPTYNLPNTRSQANGLPASDPGNQLRNMASGNVSMYLPHRDLSGELAGVPDALPDGLRSGQVYKTRDANGRTVYSGSNVKENAVITDGSNVRTGQLGGLTTVPGGPTVAGAGAGAVGAVGMNNTSGPTPGMGGFNTTPTMVDQGKFAQGVSRSNLESAIHDGLRSTSPSARAAAMAAAGQLTGADAHSGDVAGTNAAGERNTLRTTDAAKYGSDQQLKGTLATAQAGTLRAQLEMQAKLYPMQMMAKIYRDAGGDPVKAAQMAPGYGLDGKEFTALADAQQQRGVANGKDARSYFEADSTVDGKNGPEVNDAMVAERTRIANAMTGGKWDTMSPDERKAAAPRLIPAVRAMVGMNSLRNNSLLQTVGWDNPNPAATELPDFQGATVDRVGGIGGAFTGGGVSKGDWKVTLRDGRTHYLPAATTDEATLKLITDRGGRIAGQK